MQIRHETGYLSWLEFSFYIYLKNFISFRDGCIDGEERISKIAFILLAGCLSTLWEFIKESRPCQRYSKCPGRELVGWVADTAGNSQSKITFPRKSHCTIYLNTRFSLFYKILLEITRSRCHLTRTRSFPLLESWLYTWSRPGLRFWGSQADFSVVFQQTDMTDWPDFCSWKLPGDTACQTPLLLQSCIPARPGDRHCVGTVTCFCFISCQAFPRVIFAALREGKPFSIVFTAFCLRSLQRQRWHRRSILKFKEMPPILRLFSQKPEFRQISESLANRTDAGRTVSPSFLRDCDFLWLFPQREPFLAGPVSPPRFPHPLHVSAGPRRLPPRCRGGLLNPSVNFSRRTWLRRKQATRLPAAFGSRDGSGRLQAMVSRAASASFHRGEDERGCLGEDRSSEDRSSAGSLQPRPWQTCLRIPPRHR